MIEQSNLVNNTEIIAQLIIDSNYHQHSEALDESKKCLLDYLSCVESAKDIPIITKLANELAEKNGNQILLGQRSLLTSSNQAALFNGFAGHYLDYDDVHANLRGHPSVVIFSALLSLINDENDLKNFLFAYVVGVELSALIGKQINPAHKLDGYHTTATIGVFGAVAAISKLKNLNLQQVISILSFAATQSSGLGLEVGSDTKPLHAGLAARNAVQAYQFVISGLTTNKDVFNDFNGWSVVVAHRKLDIESLKKSWLSPAQINNPGIWFKQHQFCSAGMSGADTSIQAYEAGIRLSNIKRVIFHFSKDEDQVLRYRFPKNGQEGKFSIEYIFWQIIKNGAINDDSFNHDILTNDFITETSHLFIRRNDLSLGSSEERAILLEIILLNNQVKKFYVQHPKGSPLNPLNIRDIIKKLSIALNDHSSLLNVEDLIMILNGDNLNPLKKILKQL